MLQNATPLRKSAPWPPNMYCACHAKCIFPEPLQLSHACHATNCSLRLPRRTTSEPSKWSEVFLTFWLGNVLRATTACTFSTSQLPKVVWDRQFLTLLTSKCASRHNSTSKSAPTLVCFAHFDFEMCFAPQRRAIFHLSSGQMAPHPPLLRAYFSTCQSNKSLEKGSESRLFYLFAHLHLLSFDSFFFLLFSSLLLIFSSLLFSSLLWLFSSLTLPTSACPSVHIGGGLTSKLLMISYTSETCFLTWPTKDGWDVTIWHYGQNDWWMVLWWALRACLFVLHEQIEYTTDIHRCLLACLFSFWDMSSTSWWNVSY